MIEGLVVLVRAMVVEMFESIWGDIPVEYRQQG